MMYGTNVPRIDSASRRADGLRFYEPTKAISYGSNEPRKER
jgi:hypothetical protein